MRTNYVLMAIAALAIAGCSQNEITEQSPDANPAIGFDVYTGVQTRGTETTTLTIQGAGAGFGILACQTNADLSAAPDKSDFMYNEHATYSSSAWSYSNTKYWPSNTDDRLSFFAYAPYDDASNDKGVALSVQTAAPKITFTQKIAAADLVDLVAAKALNQQYSTNTGNEGKVNFSFSHILTKIDLKAQLTEALGGNDTKIFITSITLKGDGKLYEKAVYDMYEDTWDYTTTGSAAELWGSSDVLDLGGIMDKNKVAAWGYDADKGVDISSSSSSTAANVFTSGQCLYLIPVDNTTGIAAAGDAKLSVTYDVVTKVTEGTHATSSTTKEVQLPAGALKKGTFATYTLQIGLNKVEIGTVSVDSSWGTPQTGDL